MMRVKLEDEFLYWHEFIILSGDNKKYKTREQFFSAVCDFLIDRNLIIKKGKEMVKRILKERLEKENIYSKEKEVEKLLKQLKQPVEIEVEE